MKRKITATFASAVLGLSCCCGIAACDTQSGPTTQHTHEWSDVLKYDDDYHWHICTYPGCDKTDGMEKHDFSGGDCICGMSAPDKQDPEPDHHECIWAWNSDEYSHWQYCTVKGCGITKEHAPHVENGMCVCGRYIEGEPEHVHIWTTWSRDFLYHWHECEECGAVDKYEEHDYSGGDCKCGYEAPSRGSEGLEYAPLGNHAYAFCGLGTCAATEIEVADKIDGLPVTQMEGAALAGGKDRITGIKLGRNMESIQSNAFSQCEKLTEVYLPKSVEWLTTPNFSGSDLAVIYCEAEKDPEAPLTAALEKVLKPVVWDCKNNNRDEDGYEYFVSDSLRYAERDGCAKVVNQSKDIEEVDIPSTVTFGLRELNVTEIGDSAFFGCRALSRVTLPSSLKRIGSHAFGSCAALTDISIPSGLTDIGDSPFSSCSKLNYIERGNAKYIGNSDNPCILLVKAADRSITSCAIDPSTEFIDANAFDFCDYLSAVDIPSSVKHIGSNAFSYCIKVLESITVQDGNTAYRSDGNCLIDIADKTLVAGCKNSVIPDDGSIVKIAGSAFSWSKIVNAVIPDGVTEIGGNAFIGCQLLENVRLPETMTKIGNGAFTNCPLLGSVKIPSGITEIGNDVFRLCKSLSEINIPSTVTKIGGYAFYGCESVESVDIPSTVESVANYAFGSCTALKSVTVANGVSIETESFSNCGVIEHLTAPLNMLDRFSRYALTTLVLTDVDPEIVCGLNMYSLSGAAHLQIVTLPGTLGFIETDAFDGCSSLGRIIFCGTEDQWNAVEKSDGWDNGLPSGYSVEFSR